DIKNPKAQVGVNNLTIEDNVVYDWYKGLQVTDDVPVSKLLIKQNDFQNIFSSQPINAGPAANSDEERWEGNHWSLSKQKNHKSYDERSGSGTTFSSVDKNSINKWTKY